MTVLLFGNYSTGDGYPRLRVLAEGLRARGVEVRECRVPLLEGSGERVRAVSSPLGLAGASLRAAAGMVALARAYRRAGPHDAVLVGYPGHAAVLVARWCNRRGGRPVVLDAFLSLHDTAVGDRGLAREGSLVARVLRRLDRAACRAADVVLLDTDAHAGFFRDALGVPAGKLRRVLVGALEPRAAAPGPPPSPGPLRVLWFGTYVPLQGVGTVVEAAGLLRGEGVDLTLVGRGQDLPAARERARALGLGEPAFRLVEEFVPRDDLDRRIAAADVCLGVFGGSPKAGRVVPCKVYDSLAAGKPVVTADTPAAREVLEDGRTALLVPPGDPAALAGALRRLRDEPGLRGRLAEGAKRLWRERLSPPAVAAGLAEELCRDRRRTA